MAMKMVRIIRRMDDDIRREGERLDRESRDLGELREYVGSVDRTLSPRQSWDSALRRAAMATTADPGRLPLAAERCFTVSTMPHAVYGLMKKEAASSTGTLSGSGNAPSIAETVTYSE